MCLSDVIRSAARDLFGGGHALISLPPARRRFLMNDHRTELFHEIAKAHLDYLRGQVAVHDKFLRSGLVSMAQLVRARSRESSAFQSEVTLTSDAVCEPSAAPGSVRQGEIVSPVTILDPWGEDAWLLDHCPTFTVPALPAMSMLDFAAKCARAALGRRVTEVRQFQILRWLPLPKKMGIRGRVEILSDDAARVTVEAWPNPVETTHFTGLAVGTVSTAPSPPEPGVWPSKEVLIPELAPYERGTLFHGPSLRMLTALSFGVNSSEGIIDTTLGSAPDGYLGQGLLDALIHVLPHDSPDRWDARISAEQVAFPSRIDRLTIYSPRPEERVRVRARYLGLEEPRYPRFELQATDEVSGKVWLELELTEVLFSKGPIGVQPPASRKRFLLEREYVANVALSDFEPSRTTARMATVKASDWLPGTVASIYGAEGADPVKLLEAVAVGDHVSHRAGVHPRSVSTEHEAGQLFATSTMVPFNQFPVSVSRGLTHCTVVEAGPEKRDFSPVHRWWAQWFGQGRWPGEDIFHGLVDRFVNRVIIHAPDAFAAVHGQSLIYLGNHQVGIESLIFSNLASALNGVTTLTLAKIEHQRSWLGSLIAQTFSWPGVNDPGVITFFDRRDKASLPTVVAGLSQTMMHSGQAVMVHVEGTRSLQCRRPPVQRMSSVFLDLSLRTRAAIIPVRFSGALPTEEMPHRLEYPVNLGRFDIHLGRPILPSQLLELPLKQRKQFVLDAINHLGPDWRLEEPLKGHPEQIARAESWATATGTNASDAVLLDVLMELESPSPGIESIVRGVVDGKLCLPDSPQGWWLAGLARRLYGPRGPSVVVG